VRARSVLPCGSRSELGWLVRLQLAGRFLGVGSLDSFGGSWCLRGRGVRSCYTSMNLMRTCFLAQLIVSSVADTWIAARCL